MSNAIPDDIRSAAHIVAVSFETRIQSGEFDDQPDGTQAREALIAEVEKAIAAERERCARCCDDVAERWTAFSESELAEDLVIDADGSAARALGARACAYFITKGVMP